MLFPISDNNLNKWKVEPRIDIITLLWMFKNDKMDGNKFITRIFDYTEYDYYGFIKFNDMIQYIRFIKNNNIVFDKKSFTDKFWETNNRDTFYICYRFQQIPLTTYITNKLNCQLLYDVDDMESKWLLLNNITKFNYMHNIGYKINIPLIKIFI